jgi:hypothetical protein
MKKRCELHCIDGMMDCIGNYNKNVKETILNLVECNSDFYVW